MCGGGGGYEEKEPESKLALAQQAAISLQRYGETFVPLENAFIQDNLNAFGESAYKGSMGRASNQVAQMYENQMPDYQKGIFTAGIDPTSGAYQGKIDSIQKAKARSMGQGISAAGIDQSTNALIWTSTRLFCKKRISKLGPTVVTLLVFVVLFVEPIKEN